ncbi:SIS domain-containing protein [Erysipelotrichaceae bacterium RD49]|nr:SIS domain-containing protein [Erysipelotrichaceae bacterium RD49]
MSQHGGRSQSADSSLQKQAEAILKSRRIFLYGAGNEQKSIARYLQSRLLSVGLLCQNLFDEGEVAFCLPQMDEQDLFILISLSVSSSSLMRLVNRLQKPKTMSFTRALWYSVALELKTFNGHVPVFWNLVWLYCHPI